jgi:hypothetical protein
MATSSEAAIWERIIHPEGTITPRTARALLKLTFPPHDRMRMHELAVKAQEGTLTPDEELQIDDFERIGTMLSILKSKARKVLKQTAGPHAT